MILCIAGSRHIPPHAVPLCRDLVQRVLIDFAPNLVLNGACPSGVDAVAAQTCERLGVRVEFFPADWGRHGKAAGPIRNKAMAERATHVAVLWDGASRGSGSMVREAARLKKPLWQVIWPAGSLS